MQQRPHAVEMYSHTCFQEALLFTRSTAAQEAIDDQVYHGKEASAVLEQEFESWRGITWVPLMARPSTDLPFQLFADQQVIVSNYSSSF